MKQVKDVTACVIDYGTFLCVAEKLAESMKKVFYHSPFNTEYQDIRNCVIGEGLERVTRLDDYLDPAVLGSIDLFVFPDIGFADVQRHLRSLGKAVWGHMGADRLELSRTDFIDCLHDVRLDDGGATVVVGLSSLAAHLKKHRNQWVKVNRYRANMETWKHTTYANSERTLEGLAVIFGGYKEQVVFIVQPDIPTETECGYDGWCIEGAFPSHSFHGYEKKNELYLGSLQAKEDLPAEVQYINNRMANVLQSFGYRCWWATEIRIGKDGIPYFIDPTPRMAGQTMEHQLESLVNFAEVVWAGANGILIEPYFLYSYAAEATLHYELESKDPAVSDEWKSLSFPMNYRVKLYRYCKVGDTYHLPIRGSDEVGVVIGFDNLSIEGAIKDLKANLKALKDQPVHANVEGFDELLKSIKKGIAKGIPF